MVPAPTPLLRVMGVSKSYREGGSEAVVLRDASLELAPGETTSIVGASGSGKSTLLGVIAGLLQPGIGPDHLRRVRHHPLRRHRTRAPARGTHRGGPPERQPHPVPHRGGERRARHDDRGWGQRQAAGTGDSVGLGLARRLHHRPGQLSGGEAQRVSVAVALANDPDLLLADEATGELDAATAEQVMGFILDVCRERALTLLTSPTTGSSPRRHSTGCDCSMVRSARHEEPRRHQARGRGQALPDCIGPRPCPRRGDRRRRARRQSRHHRSQRLREVDAARPGRRTRPAHVRSSCRRRGGDLPDAGAGPFRPAPKARRTRLPVRQPPSLPDGVRERGPPARPVRTGRRCGSMPRALGSAGSGRVRRQAAGPDVRRAASPRCRCPGPGRQARGDPGRRAHWRGRYGQRRHHHRCPAHRPAVDGSNAGGGHA